mgnify:CR=1 FL=1
MTLGERIKNYRHKAGLSQEQLAEKINVSRQAITKWENDSGIPDIDNLISLSKVMGISLDELVMGEKENDISDIKRSAINQRNRNCKLYLIAVISFSIAWFCWFIILLLNVVDGNTATAVLSGINTTLLGLPIGIFSRKYYDAKKSQ